MKVDGEVIAVLGASGDHPLADYVLDIVSLLLRHCHAST